MKINITFSIIIIEIKTEGKYHYEEYESYLRRNRCRLFYAKVSSEISLALARYMDAGKPVSEEETIQKIKMMISYCNDWMEDIFDGILKDGINP